VLRFSGKPGGRTRLATPLQGRVRFLRMDPAFAYLCPVRPAAAK
jgi:hypothetical protein